MKISKGKLLASFALAGTLLLGGSAFILQPEQKTDNTFDCPEAKTLEKQSTFNKWTGRTDPVLEDMLQQQYDVCDMRGLRKLNTGPGKTYNPWEEVELTRKNFNSPIKADI